MMKLIGAAWMIPAFGFRGIGVNIAITWSVMTAYLGVVYLARSRKRLHELEMNDRSEKNRLQLRKDALSWIS